MKIQPLFALLLTAVAMPVCAHTPYLAPVSFEAREGSVVSLDAAFAEAFFVPEVVFDNSEFVVLDPTGQAHAPDTVQRFKTRAVVEHKLGTGKGTYRFSTGPRLGAIFRTWELNGKTESARDPATPVPAGAKMLVHYQSLSVSEAYVTVGAPTAAAVSPYGKGLELVPATHPGDLYAGEGFDFNIHYDGRPLPKQKVEIFRATGDERSEKAVATLTTGDQGEARFAMDTPGTYLALIRYRSAAPAGAAVPEYGYNYTLTFHVLAP